MFFRRNRVVVAAVLSTVGALSVAASFANGAETGAAAESEPVVLQEVTVTAQRRAENLQRVPIAISTVSAEDAQLRGAVSLQTISTTVPNLTTTGSQGTSIFIRGVGNTSASASDEPSAATYIDGVYMPSTFGLIGYKFNNIERVEVLKGPQGTLFGRNATAGVIQIITPDPKHELQGSADVGYANYNTVNADAYITGGLTDTLAADLSVLYENQMDGWGHDLTTQSATYRHKNRAARSKWLYTPTESTKVNVVFDFSNFWYDSGTQLSPGSRAADHVTTYPGKFNSFGDVNEDYHEQYGASVRVDHDFAALPVHGVSITAYRDVDAHIVLDNDRTAAMLSHVNQYNDADYVTQEFQLSNRDPGRVTWLAGAFFDGNLVGGADPRIVTGTSVTPAQYQQVFGRQKTRSYSGFGQATADLFADTKLTLGLRYTTETLTEDGRYLNRAGQVYMGPYNSQIKSEPWTWRTALDHQFSPNVLGYVSYNRGFKSGGYNLNTPQGAPFFPETIDAYEMGMKSEFLDHRLRLNLAGFYYDYKNLQVAIVPGNAGQIFTNAAAARNYGADANLDFAATEHLTLSVGAGWLDAKFKSYPDAQGFSILGVPFLLADAKGKELPYSPPFSGFVSGSYAIPTPVGDFKASTSLSYSDKSYITADNSFSIPAYFLLSSSVEWWSKAVKPVGVRLWGRNLTNTYHYDARIESTGGWYQIPAAPRQYGVTLLARF